MPENKEAGTRTHTWYSQHMTENKEETRTHTWYSQHTTENKEEETKTHTWYFQHMTENKEELGDDDEEKNASLQSFSRPCVKLTFDAPNSRQRRIRRRRKRGRRGRRRRTIRGKRR